MLMVYKYAMPVTDDFALSLPTGAKILSVQEQHGSPQVWCLVDVGDGIVYETRYFRLAGTGHPINIPEDWLHYVATWQSLAGTLIWHLFEVICQEEEPTEDAP